ncbi:MAG: PAS domain S-box protein [Candidatus Lokiarchaeota archaeon]|nr:PAS domain S-box protein [Candidatus Lokiarchaeota archaeon]
MVMKLNDLKLLVSIIEGTNDMIHSILPDDSFELVNSAWLESLGYEDKDVSNLHVKDIIFPGNIAKYHQYLKDAFSGKVVKDIQTVFLTKEGDMLPVEGSLFPRYSGDEIVAVVGFFRDIAKRIELEKDLEESRARTEFFVDLLVHDLTNIHQEVLTTLEILSFNESLDSDSKLLVKGSLREIERASDIVSNVRKMNRLYAIKPEARVVDLYGALTGAVKEVKKAFPDKELKLETNISRGDLGVVADEFLEDIFYSLLHNSMKFDQKEEVQIEVIATKIKHTPFLKVQVKDHGPGIPDVDKESVFSRLSHRRESITGLGLGLTIVKKIIENYGGFIRVEDRVEGKPSKGCNFVMLLRYQTDFEKEEDA